MPFLRCFLFLILFFIFSVIAGHGDEIHVEEECLLPDAGFSLMKSSSLPGRGGLAMPELCMGWLKEKRGASLHSSYHSKYPPSPTPESFDERISKIKKVKWRKKGSRYYSA